MSVERGAGSETLFDEMKRYVRFGPADAAALRALGDRARPHFRTITEEFYERVREHEAAHAVFRDEAQIERLKGSLVRWMERLCAGPHDEDYFLERAKIGRVHVKIGLPQRYMFTAMALIRVALESHANALDPAEVEPARTALSRVLDLELAIMLETYRDDFVARLQRVERTERKALEKALARSEQRYASAIELASVLVVGLDRNGLILVWNREAESVTGYARDEALGRSFVELLLASDLRDAASAQLVRASGGDVSDQAWELPLRARSGRERLVAFHLTHVPDDVGDDVAVFAIGPDVTDVRAREERTLQSEKLAAVGTLAAGLAHEIRNPLNGALLHVTFLDRALARANASTDALEAVKLVGDEIRRLSALVRDFLVFARPAPADRERASLRAVAQRVVEIAAADATTAGATLLLDGGSAELVVELDKAKMEQALLNLVRNAIDAVAGAQGHVTVRLRRRPRHVVVEIEDDGPGLPSPDAPIFDAFFSTKPHGTGLGLAIVHRIVTDHAGSIEVESAPGRTLFRVILPIEELT